MTNPMTIIGVIGAGSCSDEQAALAGKVGELVAARGAALVCGGLGGVMQAAARGAAARGGLTIGILPGSRRDEANPDIAVPIVTDLGHARNALEILRFADLRYAGQAHEITIPVAIAGVADDPGELDFVRLAEAFGNEHERTYGHQAEREEVECVALRVVARVASDGVPQALKAAVNPGGSAQALGRRLAWFGPRHDLIETPVIGRMSLAAAPRPGPLIVEEYDSTCVVPPGWSAALDLQGNIVLTAG